MDILIGIIVVLVIILSFILLSYPVLKWFGVRDQIWERSWKFGMSILGIMLLSQIPLNFLFGGFLGPLLSSVFIYIYINKKLEGSTKIKALVSVLFPMAAGLIASPFLLILFKSANA